MYLDTCIALNPLARLVLAGLVDNRETIDQELSFLNPERQQKTQKTDVQITSSDPTFTLAHQEPAPHQSWLLPELPTTLSKTGMIKEINLSLWQLPLSPFQG